MDAVLLVGLIPLIPDFTRPPGPRAAVGVTRPGLAGFVRAAWIGPESMGNDPLPPSGARPSQRLTGTCPSQPGGYQSEFVSG